MRNYSTLFQKTDSGEIIWKGRHTISKALELLNPDRYILQIKKYEFNRSTQQNAFYWKMISIISDHTGYEKDEMHEILKYKFLKRAKIDEQSGEIFEYVKSTTKLTVQEFSEYIDMVKRFSTQELGCDLPDDF